MIYVAFIVALWAYVRICKRANTEIAPMKIAHAHDWLLYHTTTDRVQNGTVVISWVICADCKTERATCARLSMTDLTPVRLPRPE
jgi:hypothetical protein